VPFYSRKDFFGIYLGGLSARVCWGGFQPGTAFSGSAAGAYFFPMAAIITAFSWAGSLWLAT